MIADVNLFSRPLIIITIIVWISAALSNLFMIIVIIIIIYNMYIYMYIITNKL